MSFSCECSTLSGRGFCDGPIPRPEDSYQVCVTECGQVEQQPSKPTTSRQKEVRLRKKERNGISRVVQRLFRDSDPEHAGTAGIRFKRARQHVSSQRFNMARHSPSTQMPPQNLSQLRRNTNKMQLVIEFIIPKFIEGSKCFERHIAHHQEL